MFFRKGKKGFVKKFMRYCRGLEHGNRTRFRRERAQQVNQPNANAKSPRLSALGSRLPELWAQSVCGATGSLGWCAGEGITISGRCWCGAGRVATQRKITKLKKLNKSTFRDHK